MAPDRVERLDATDLTPEVVALLLAAAGPGATPRAVVEPYQQGATLLGVRRGDSVVGVLGFDRDGASRATVRALAVDAAHRRAGHARALVHAAGALTGLPMVAETDRDAVGFYRACGFDVTDLGERYTGVRRFRCVLRASTGARRTS